MSLKQVVSPPRTAIYVCRPRRLFIYWIPVPAQLHTETGFHGEWYGREGDSLSIVLRAGFMRLFADEPI